MKDVIGDANSVLSLSGLVLFFGLVLIGASHLRLKYGRRGVAVLSCIAGTVLPVGLAIVSGMAAYAGLSLVIQLENPRPATHLKSDWGSEMPAEDRAKYSLFLAESTYIEREEIVEYFNLQGQKVAFAPTEAQRTKRREHLAYIEWLQRQSVQLALLCLFSIFLPLLALWLSRTSVAQRVIDLESRWEATRRKSP
jgi:hypothetical protein